MKKKSPPQSTPARRNPRLAVVLKRRWSWMCGESMRLRSAAAVFCIAVLSGTEAHAQVNVTQEHNNASRDGLYIDAGFTLSTAANLTRDLNFNGVISGDVYAQPLYIEGGLNGPMIIAVTGIQQRLCAQRHCRHGNLAAKRRCTSSIKPARVR